MKIAKKRNKILCAYCLGAGSTMEKELVKTGVIRLLEDGRYELFSQEAKSGSGQLAEKGDYFKVDVVDGKFYPYPNKKDFFVKNHRHIEGDTYEQIGQPMKIWEVGEPLFEEVRYILDKQMLFLKPDDPEHYFNAHLWGADLSADKDSVLVFHRVKRDENGKISEIRFNFIARPEFKRDYELLQDV